MRYSDLLCRVGGRRIGLLVPGFLVPDAPQSLSSSASASSRNPSGEADVTARRRIRGVACPRHQRALRHRPARAAFVIDECRSRATAERTPRCPPARAPSRSGCCSGSHRTGARCAGSGTRSRHRCRMPTQARYSNSASARCLPRSIVRRPASTSASPSPHGRTSPRLVDATRRPDRRGTPTAEPGFAATHPAAMCRTNSRHTTVRSSRSRSSSRTAPPSGHRTPAPSRRLPPARRSATDAASEDGRRAGSGSSESAPLERRSQDQREHVQMTVARRRSELLLRLGREVLLDLLQRHSSDLKTRTPGSDVHARSPRSSAASTASTLRVRVARKPRLRERLERLPLRPPIATPLNRHKTSPKLGLRPLPVPPFRRRPERLLSLGGRPRRCTSPATQRRASLVSDHRRPARHEGSPPTGSSHQGRNRGQRGNPPPSRTRADHLRLCSLIVARHEEGSGRDGRTASAHQHEPDGKGRGQLLTLIFPPW